jgi:hypothetical protein
MLPSPKHGETHPKHFKYVKLKDEGRFFMKQKSMTALVLALLLLAVVGSGATLKAPIPQAQAAEPTPTDAQAAGEAAQTGNSKPLPFTATTGLDTFSSYRMDFAIGFDGARQGQPTVGSLDGTLEATRYPSAKHLWVAMEGDASGQLAGLEKAEVYEIGNTVYFQNPQDGAWMSLPSGLVYSMLPSDTAISPEAYINLPVTAVPQSGLETINGVVTRRYTFGRDDLADGSSYDRVKGTAWVAVKGNYVVRYEAAITGDLRTLVPDGMELMDDGTVTMVYEVSDVNSDLTIEPPIRNRGLNLGSLLSGLSSFR